MAEPGPASDRLAVGFAQLLRRLDVDVTTGRTLTYGQALGAVGLHDRTAVYWAGRATLISRPEDIDTYDRGFAAYWEQAPPGPVGVPAPERIAVTLALDVGADETAADPPPGELPDESDGPVLTVRWSRADVLRHRDFAACSPSELDEARRLMADLRLAGALRRSRRLRPVRRKRSGARADLRRTVRRALRAGGEPIVRAHRAPSTRPRRLVLLCDVSGSMEPYARGLVRFLHAAVVGRGRVEAFAVGTRLTRITRELSSRDPDAALAAAARQVVDWSGGTRLGEGLREFNDRWGVKGMARGSVVVVLSDGWDRGDPEVLAEQMARLARVAHRVVWVNPLKASPGFAPLAQGMAAALPYVDELLDGSTVASLEKLAAVVARP